MHGARWAPEAGIRWIADAKLIIGAGRIDWRRLVDQTAGRRFVLRMRETLEFLRAAIRRGADRKVATLDLMALRMGGHGQGRSQSA